MTNTINNVQLTDEQDCAVSVLAALRKDVQTMGGFAGCLSGDTVLQYGRGTRVGSRPITMQDMYLKFNGYNGSGRGAAQRWDTSIPTLLYSVWPDGSVGKNQVVSVLKSGVKPTIRLDFSNGRHLVLTEDHPIATPSGEYVKAGLLKIGEMVLAVGDMKTKSVGRRPLSERPNRILVNVKYHPLGGAKTVVCNGIAYQYTRVARARLVVEAAMNNVSYERFIHCLKRDEEVSAGFEFIPAEYDVHHVDENPMNDSIENLEVILHCDHPLQHDPGKHFNREYSLEVEVIRIASDDERMTYDIQMTSPANNFSANGIFVHNTGKTTVIKSLVERLRNTAVCAFTGKAAQVLRRKGVSASTIHSLIYVAIPDEDGNVTFELRDELEYDAVVVDEASMVNEFLYKDLKSFGVPLIFVGDHGQLEPVGGNGFNLMSDPDITLEKIHRNAGEIALFAEHLRKGEDAKDWVSGDKVSIVTADELDVEADQMICAYNATRIMLNDTVREHLERPQDRPVVGDRVICLQNDRAVGIFNGMQGTIAAVDDKFLTFDPGDRDIRVRYNPLGFRSATAPKRVTGQIPFDYSYCVTCHKAQGDEWDHVMVWEQKCDRWSHQRWAYTAASRAKNKLTWVLPG